MANRLWAITCLFNPAGYRSRIENYRIFRQHLELPLVTVELAFDESFSLGDGDAETLIQIRGGDRMWQKERLLNLALQALPPECDQVMWIDADMVVVEPGWGEAVSVKLEQYPVLQPFLNVNYLGSQGETVSQGQSTTSFVIDAIREGGELDFPATRTGTGPCGGHAWAARRDVVDRHGLYDRCIVGGGDTAFFCGVTGRFDRVIQKHQMTEAQRQRYMAWAEPVFAEVQAQVDFAPFTLNHLWHGSMEDRRARQRHADLAALRFDPYRDIALDEQGLWRWASDRPELHNYVLEYFRSRNEDAETLITVPS